MNSQAQFSILVLVLIWCLDAGKTALLNRLLNDQALAGTTVIVNEFNDVGINNLLVEKSFDDSI